MGIYLQDPDVGVAFWVVATAVLSDVLEPLDVRLRVAVDLADEAGVLPDVHRGVSRKTCLEDGPVGRALCGEGGEMFTLGGID